MIYILITTCLLKNHFEERKQHYIRGITSILKRCENTAYKIVIVEGNGKRPTFLDDFGVDVLYTENNIRHFIGNTGHMEMRDILEFIEKYNVQDDDFIVKVTGRYYLADECPFFDVLKLEKFDSIFKDENCALIGMKCKYMKQITIPAYGVNLELNMTIVAKTVENKCMLGTLGIYGAGVASTFGFRYFILN